MDFTESWGNTISKVGCAVRLGKTNLLSRYLRDKKPVDVADNRGWRPLHEAAAVSPTIECLEKLLKHGGSDVNWRTHEGETALLLVCKRRHGTEASAFVSLLLQHGADPNIVDNEEDSPLLETIRNRSTVDHLLAAGADVNASDSSQWSPLHAAAMIRDPAVLQSLLAKDARIDARDECGMTPIFTAAQHGSVKCLQELLTAAKDRDMSHVVNIGAEDWATPLMIAAQQGFLNCVNLLMEFGADPNLQTTDHVTAIHLSVQGNHEECLDVLLKTMDLKPLIDSFHPTTYDRDNTQMICPLHLAVGKKSYGCLKKLLAAGFSPDSLFTCDEDPVSRVLTFLPTNETALSFAVQNRDPEAFKILLAGGASVNPVRNAYHPMLRAMRNLDPLIIHTLIDHNVNLNYPRENTESISGEVFLCSFLSHPNFMRLVLYHGCDPNHSFQNDINKLFFIRCASVLLRRKISDLPGLLKFLLRFLIVNKRVRDAFMQLNKIFPSDISEIMPELSHPSTLRQICIIKLRQHLYSIHGVKLPNMVRYLGLPSFLECDVAYYNLHLPVSDRLLT